MVGNKLSVGQAIDLLIRKHGLHRQDIAPVLHTHGGTITKIIRDEKELSFIMAIKLCKHLDIDLNEFAAMISDDEIERKEITSLRWEAKMKARQKGKGRTLS
jgi:plasmid maintenance system antidote protein VapI